MSTLNKQPNKVNISNAVLERIDSEQIVPTARWWFVGREFAVWFLWVLSVLIGALAVAVSLYVGMNVHYALYEATHDNFFTFVVSALPYLWIVVFFSMVFLSLFELRNTRRGYRYRTVEILGSSLAFSLVGGLVFSYVGFGYLLDQSLGKQLSNYMSTEKRELHMWQMPEEGRLVGGLVMEDQVAILEETDQAAFRDAEGLLWTIDGSELDPKDIALLKEERRVRVLGTSTAPNLFHLCGVFPWLFDKRVTMAGVSTQRQNFVAKIRNYKQNVKSDIKDGIEAVATLASESSVNDLEAAGDTEKDKKHCAELAVVLRMQEESN